MKKAAQATGWFKDDSLNNENVTNMDYWFVNIYYHLDNSNVGKFGQYTNKIQQKQLL